MPNTTKNEPFIMFPEPVAFNTTLSDKARPLWNALERFSGLHLTCWPGYTALADKVGCSPRWVPTLVKELVDAGLLLVQFRPGKSNVYTLLKRINRQPRPTQEAATSQPMNRTTNEQKQPTKTNYKS